MAAARVLVIEGDKNLSHVSGPRPRRYSRQGHDLDDPTGKTLEEVRGIRDEIEARVRRLLSGMSTTASVE